VGHLPGRLTRTRALAWTPIRTGARARAMARTGSDTDSSSGWTRIWTAWTRTGEPSGLGVGRRRVAAGRLSAAAAADRRGRATGSLTARAGPAGEPGSESQGPRRPAAAGPVPGGPARLAVPSQARGPAPRLAGHGGRPGPGASTDFGDGGLRVSHLSNPGLPTGAGPGPGPLGRDCGIEFFSSGAGAMPSCLKCRIHREAALIPTHAHTHTLAHARKHTQAHAHTHAQTHTHTHAACSLVDLAERDRDL
jgi:hypothetical protein